jgi:site-specific DNA-cytosine methylase
MRWHSASSRTSREEIAGAIATRPQRGDLDTHGAYVIEHMASIVGTLCARDSKDINSDDLDTKLIAYGRSQFANYTEGIGTLQASHRQEDVVIPHEKSVRRLTPRECERLMSWPDDWTRYRADGKEQADSHRYKQAGNGVVSNVAEWIGRRIMQAQEETTT